MSGTRSRRRQAGPGAARAPLAWAFGLAAALAAAPLAAAAQRVDTDTLAADLFLLRTHHSSESWVNSLLLRSPDGAVLVDHAGDWRTLSADSALAAAVRGAMQALGVAEPRWLVDTHWHGDHSAGNTLYPGATVVATRGTAARLAERQSPPWYPDGIGPMAPEGHPDLVFADSLLLRLGGERIHLWHFGPSHTDGDAVVYFERADAVHMGDLYHGADDPSFGEDMRGLAATLRAVLERVGAGTRVVTGHGRVTDRDALDRYQRMLSETIEHVARQRADGRTTEEVQAAGLPAPWRDVIADPDVVRGWLAEIYTSLTSGR